MTSKSHIGIFILRLFIGIRLLYGVIDNIMNWDKMLEFSHFLKLNNFPYPTLSATISVYAQFICSLCILLGFKIKLASVIMLINFTVALVFIHFRNKDSIEIMTPALAMWFGCLTFLFTGADKIALNYKLMKR